MPLPQCIFCLNTDRSFEQEEHVVPQQFGLFPLSFRGDMVCDACNNMLGNSLESEFKKDSVEGHVADKFDVKPSKTTSNRRTGKRFKFTVSGDDDLGVFAHATPYFDKTLKQMCLRPLIVMKDLAGVPQTFFPNAIAKLKGKARAKKLAVLSSMDRKGIRIFGDESFPAEKSIELLAECGVVFEEESRDVLEPERKLRIIEHFQSAMDDDLMRVPAKIAFEYFAYCAQLSGWRAEPFKDTFAAIREYVLNGTGTGLVTVRMEPILGEETRSGQATPRLIAHVLGFREVDGWILGQVSLFNLVTYEVRLGRYGFSSLVPRTTFGCGHALNPLTKEVRKLHGSPIPHLNPKQFGLFTS